MWGLEKKVQKVKSFYEKFPFPNSGNKLKNMFYDSFFRLNFIDFKKKNALDVGCGTGENTAIIAKNISKVIAIDISKNSVEKAREFVKKKELKNITFIIDDFNKYRFKEKFDFVFLEGVLHHIPPYKESFSKISKLLKKGGYIVLALYNPYGAFFLRIKRFLIKILSLGNKKIALHISKNLFRKDYKLSETWLADKYTNPFELYFSISKILNLFDKNNIKYLFSCPPIELNEYKILLKFYSREKIKKYFLNNVKLHSRKSGKLSRFSVQLIWLLANSDYYYIVGRK